MDSVGPFKTHDRRRGIEIRYRPAWSTDKKKTPHGRGNVPAARNPNPKPHKTPKSSYPQKQHNTAIKFLLFLGSPKFNASTWPLRFHQRFSTRMKSMSGVLAYAFVRRIECIPFFSSTSRCVSLNPSVALPIQSLSLAPPSTWT